MSTNVDLTPIIIEHDRISIDNFFDAIAPWDKAYKNASFSFIGLINEGHINLVQGQLVLSNSPPNKKQKLVKTKSLLAGYFSLEESGFLFKDFLLSLLSCSLSTPFGTVKFPLDEENRISTYFQGLPGGIENDFFRNTKLDIYGGRHPQALSSQMLSLELRSAETPYESIQELASELNLNSSQGDRAAVTVTAFHVAELDNATRVTGEKAEIGVFLSFLLEPSLISVGYRVLVKGKVVERCRVEGEMFTWSERNNHWYGLVEIAVPLGAVLQCFVSYREQAQHYGWIADPDTFPNARRVAHNIFDPGLQILRNYLFEEKSQRAQSRDFEVGVANLLFLLGFSVDPFFGKPLEDGPDLLAVSSSGNILVIECTTGLINKEGKLGKLSDRVESIRSKLKASSINHIRVLPVIVTCRPTDGIAEKGQAKLLGIVVVALEDLVDVIERTVLPQNTDLLFNQAWESVQRRDSNQLNLI